MFHNRFFKVLGKVLQFYAGLTLAAFLFQIVGLILYFIYVWPGVQDNFAAGVARFIGLAVFLCLIRSCLWIQIYWSGSRSFALLQQEGDSPQLAGRLAPVLKTLTRLLVLSCILDVCFVPVIFLSDQLLPFTVSGFWLGIVDFSILFFPQAFGISALILAFLTHQYGQLLLERSQMKEEIELTI